LYTSTSNNNQTN